MIFRIQNTITPNFTNNKKYIKTKFKLIFPGFLFFLFFSLVLPITANSQNYEDSPFGFHPGNANNYIYIQDLGASWSREGSYFVWDWVDVNRNGSFKFKEAIAPPKPDIPSSGDTINYDIQLLNIPDNIIILGNICPFRKGGEFATEAEKDIYYNFVKATIERYDGDNDLGCTESYPDCYYPGDNEYPNQQLIERLKINPVKHWQVCNQVFDACEIDCQNTYAEKFAEVQRLTYLAAKEADPDVLVLIAGDSQMEDYPEVFNELNGSYIDIIDLHRFGEESQYNPGFHLNYLKTALIYAGFNLNDLQFWITETNTYSGDPVPSIAGVGTDLPYQDERQHARGLLKIYISDLAQGVEKVFWAWNIVEGFKRDGAIFDYGGLIYDGYEWTGVSSDDPNGVYSNNPEDVLYDKGEGIKKLAYYTYKLMTEKLEDSDWYNIQTIQESNDIHAYKFMKNEKTVWVIWSDENSGSISLSGITTNTIRITETVPNVNSGANLHENDYPNFFTVYNQNVNNGSVTINIGDVPVFVEENDVTSVFDDITVEQNINVYPNPTDGIFKIIGNNIQLIEITNTKGQVILKMENRDPKLTIDLSQQAKGIYFIKLTVGRNVVMKKVMVL